MPTVLFFGQMADAAGRRTAVFEASTLDDLVRQASDHFGSAFEQLLPICHVWVNGEEAGAGCTLGETDEVAFLPPVSGG